MSNIPALIEDRHVENTLRGLMKGVQASGEVPEENLDDVVSVPLLRGAELIRSTLSSKECARSAKGNI